MRPRGTLIQGALAVVGLGAAYATWQREPDKGATEVVVLEAKKSDVARVRFEDDKGFVELWRGDKTDGDEATVWVKISAREERGQKLPEREVRGNEASLRLLDSFAPLKASRALGPIAEAAKLKEFGLAPPDPPAVPDGGTPPAPVVYKKRTIAVTARGDTRTFLVGTPPGMFATYIKDERDGKVYLLGGSLIGDLESASTRMVDRTLHGFKGGDYDAISVESGGKKRDLVVTGDQPNTTRIAPAKSPDKPDETLKNWHEKLFRVFPSDVLGKGEKPTNGEPQSVLKVAYAHKGKDKGFLEVGKIVVPAPPAAAAPATPPPAADPHNPHAPPPPPAGPTTEYWARSEHTAGWVKLGFGADDLVKEAEKIAGAE